MANADTLIGGGADNITDDARLMPFVFGCMGSLHSSFSVSTNGIVYLTPRGGSNNYFQIIPISVQGNILNYKWQGSGMGTSKNGAIVSKTFGNEPYRKFVISFEKMSLSKRMGNDDATFQVALHEGSGIVQFIYGAMNVSDSLAGVSYPALSKTNANQHRIVNIATHTSSFSTAAPWSGYTLNPGTIFGLHSPINGNCRTYIFTPPSIPNYLDTQLVMNPIVSGVANMTIPEFSSSYTYFYRVANTSTGPFSVPSQVSSLQIYGSPDSTFYYRVYRSNGAAISSNYALGSVTFASPRKFISQNSGFWSSPATWGVTASTQPPTWGDTVIVAQGDTVKLDVFGSATASEMTVSGVVDFGNAMFNPLTVINLKVDTTGLVWAHNGSTASNPAFISGGTLMILGNLTGAGKVDMRYNGCKLYIRSIDTAGIHVVDVNFEQANNGVPLLNSLTLSAYKNVHLQKPVTINKEILGLYGTIVTHNNLTLNRTAMAGTQSAPSNLSIYRYSRAPLFSGAVSYTANTYPDLHYLGNFQIYESNTAFKVLPFFAGNEIPSNDSIRLLKVSSNAGVVFSDAVTVTNTLEYENGHVEMSNGNDFIFAGNNYTYSAGGIKTNGWVKFFQYQYPYTGGMNTPGNSSVYPIISNGAKRFAFLQGALAADGLYSVKHTNIAGTTPFSSVFTENGITFTRRSNAYWEVLSPTGTEFTSNAFHFRAGDMDSVTNHQLVTVSYSNGAAAGSFLPTIGRAAAAIVSRTGLNAGNIGANHFHVAIADGVPLSQDLLSFTGKAREDAVLLEWTLAENNDLTVVELQKSSDGRTFESLTEVTPTAQTINYNYLDEHPFAPDNFYRLQLRSSDIRISYSNIVLIQLKEANGNIQLFPNPASQTLYINAKNTHLKQYHLYNTSGALQMSGAFGFGSGSLHIDVSRLPADIYYLKLLSDTGNPYTLKFVKD